jgi:hypothetical protein
VASRQLGCGRVVIDTDSSAACPADFVDDIIACAAVGLDPGLGIVHNDAKARQSMALDLLEPVRPEVESFVLDTLEARTYRRAEFTETEDGDVRLRAPLATN